MEALMAGTAILEVFMASVGIATLIAIVVLRGSFALMRGAGIGRQPVLRLRARPAAPVAHGATGGLAHAPAVIARIR
jgi:hypothetical protein